ncbi:MAG: hypothetical protein JSV56_11045 [Methanomassiliicoccales archaeon]|nr:MAG: hypothetical protein JSV56_11045 [Methanomassiliicoccales archaeon]
MKYWIKAIIEILVVIVLCCLSAELYYGSTMGYGTGVQGKFKEDLYIKGEIEYNVNNLQILGEEWEAKFYNLSGIYIRFFDYSNILYENTYFTSNLTVTAIGGPKEHLPYISLYNITSNSNFASSASFKKQDDAIYWDSTSENKITGTIENGTYDDILDFRDIIVITDNETINISLELAQRGWFYLIGDTGNIHFDISLGRDYILFTITDLSGETAKGDTIYFKGEPQGSNFYGNIWSNGKLYSGNPRLSGDMEITILQNPETYYNHESHIYDWELGVEGKDISVEGNGNPFWSFGLLPSIIPSVIIIAYHVNKKILRNKRNYENNR